MNLYSRRDGNHHSKVSGAAFSLLALWGGVSSALAQPLITQPFDSGLAGWGVYNDGSNLTWLATGGNPGGHLRAQDSGGGTYWGFTAGSAFLGDRSCMYGGVLTFQMKVSHNTGDSASQPDIAIIGGGLTLVYDLPLPAINVWVSREVVLSETAGWRLTSLTGAVPTATQFKTALANVTAIRFRSEVSTANDTGYIDNVAMGVFLLTNPDDLATCPGRSAQLSVSVKGGIAPFTYQWRRNEAPIDPLVNPSATTPTFTIAAVELADAGLYDCVVVSSSTGSCNSITSKAVALDVRDCPYGSCAADYDASGGTPDSTDIDAFFTEWLAGRDCADVDCSGGTPDSTDIDAFFALWLAGGC
jgi:hypothetical protein